MELNRRIFIAEAVVLAVPLTGLLALGVPSFSIPEQFWPSGAIGLIMGLATLATLSGWRLLIAGIRGGAKALRETHLGWWLAASLGCVLVVAGIVSWLLRPSPEYTPMAEFREYLNGCSFGLPLVFVLAHLWAEARHSSRYVS